MMLVMPSNSSPWISMTTVTWFNEIKVLCKIDSFGMPTRVLITSCFKILHNKGRLDCNTLIIQLQLYLITVFCIIWTLVIQCCGFPKQSIIFYMLVLFPSLKWEHYILPFPLKALYMPLLQSHMRGLPWKASHSTPFNHDSAKLRM